MTDKMIRYVFEDEEGNEDTFTTVNGSEASAYGQENERKVIVQTFQYVDSEMVGDYTMSKTDIEPAEKVAAMVVGAQIDAYAGSARKDRFHKEGNKTLKMLAKAMGTDKSEYDLRSNKGGIAVGGEITLHTDHVYVQIGQSRDGVLYRSCNGRKDYTGGMNLYWPWAKLKDLEAFAARLKTL